MRLIVLPEHRQKIRANHSATHLLQRALRTVLGSHVQQAGSRVDSEKLRFDFQHSKKVTLAEQEKVELLVNDYIRNNVPARIQQMPYKEAVKGGALAFFGEQYGEDVRVVQFEDISTELCGGSHVRATGDIGFFRIVSESGVSSGIRRIVAATGEEAVKQAQATRDILESLSALLQVPPDSLEQQVTALISGRKRGAEKKPTAASLMSNVQHLPDGTPYLFAEVNLGSSGMRELALDIAERTGGVVCLVSHDEERVSVTITVAKSLTTRLHADAILKKVISPIEGQGGGRAHLAQGGGRGKAELKAVFEAGLSRPDRTWN